MRLLVVCFSLPPSSTTRSLDTTIAAHPPGPGLPLLAPSVKIKIFPIALEYINNTHTGLAAPV